MGLHAVGRGLEHGAGGIHDTRPGSPVRLGGGRDNESGESQGTSDGGHCGTYTHVLFPMWRRGPAEVSTIRVAHVVCEAW